MTTTASKQMTTGKAFEYALLFEFWEKLKNKTSVEIVKNSSYKIAKGCFENVNKNIKSDYLLSASFAVNFLMDIEPRLSNGISKNDILQLEILPDSYGNFGEKWLGIKSSKEYFDIINPIFKNLEEIKKKSNAKKKWSELGDYHSTVYVPILKAFIKELKMIYEINPTKVASNLIIYLVGNKDFYKVVKRRNDIEIHAYNLYGTLNLPFKNIFPKYKTPKVPLPTKIISIDFKLDSNTTVIVKMNNNWMLSFRIHNASSRVESSLKFDVNLLMAPKKLFRNTLNFNQ